MSSTNAQPAAPSLTASSIHGFSRLQFGPPVTGFLRHLNTSNGSLKIAAMKLPKTRNIEKRLWKVNSSVRAVGPEYN